MYETGITAVHRPMKILALKSMKQVGKIMSGEWGRNVTVVCAVSASGIYIPPMFILPRKNMSAHLMENTPVGSVRYARPVEWMDNSLFISWLEHFIIHAKPTPQSNLVLLLDGHESHKTLGAINMAIENAVVMVFSATFYPPPPTTGCNLFRSAQGTV